MGLASVWNVTGVWRTSWVRPGVWRTSWCIIKNIFCRILCQKIHHKICRGHKPQFRGFEASNMWWYVVETWWLMIVGDMIPTRIWIRTSPCPPMNFPWPMFRPWNDGARGGLWKWFLQQSWPCLKIKKCGYMAIHPNACRLQQHPRRHWWHRKWLRRHWWHPKLPRRHRWHRRLPRRLRLLRRLRKRLRMQHQRLQKKWRQRHHQPLEGFPMKMLRSKSSGPAWNAEWHYHGAVIGDRRGRTSIAPGLELTWFCGTVVSFCGKSGAGCRHFLLSWPLYPLSENAAKAQPIIVSIPIIPSHHPKASRATAALTIVGGTSTPATWSLWKLTPTAPPNSSVRVSTGLGWRLGRPQGRWCWGCWRSSWESWQVIPGREDVEFGLRKWKIFRKDGQVWRNFWFKICKILDMSTSPFSR